ncbi:MAG: 5-oxoprolinase subunit PxpB [Winogradskyella sp.]|uniref:5-oxoprolinase subunit PxpB n=1 Tax=Winogradskyella sp. TaxID=1883156 RepID=UPI000F3D7631|nr:5-oxoprolinase subunit PxpB [Winogradskyella sp.]RNC87068.1 MAG: 5-oxoprolinase subunit PxpB [Winogradskyella sp.]
MKYQLKYRRFGPHSILIEWPSIIDRNVLNDVLNYKNSIIDLYIKEKVEIINTYNSILVDYDNTIDKINDEIFKLKQIYSSLNSEDKQQKTLWEIPTCYDDEFGIDLEDISIAKKMSKSEIIELHSNTIYDVYFIGFLPGFLYLGGLDERLYFNRKSIPNLNVKRGSVAIGGQQTGIYPQNSPGGWHILGNSPVNFFNSEDPKPCFVKAGDMIKFVPISKHDYMDILKLSRENLYQPKSTLVYD